MKFTNEANLSSFIAKTAFLAAKRSANSACTGFFYEPKQPKELEKLKRHHHNGDNKFLASLRKVARNCCRIDSGEK